jgi:SAM-dependent methyltransferase
VDATSKDEKIANVKTVLSVPNDIKVTDQADVAFICSLYHVIYGWATEPNRRSFLESIFCALKPDGRLVIVDNVAEDGKELHSEYVDHRLVEAQMHFYGFEKEFYAEISPLRYVLDAHWLSDVVFGCLLGYVTPKHGDLARGHGVERDWDGDGGAGFNTAAPVATPR